MMAPFDDGLDGLAEADLGPPLRSTAKVLPIGSRSRDRTGSDQADQHDSAEATGPALIWHGDAEPEPPQWLVKDALPRTGIAILAGQSGVAKTFAAVDLAGSVMTGLPFAGFAGERRGGVLFLPAEGEAEIDARVSAYVAAKLVDCPDDVDPRRLPFARQADAVPTLTGEGASGRLIALAKAAQDGLAERHDGLPLALVVVDTMAAAASFKDENSASEAQTVMNVLRSVSRATGALVLAVDHFGKLAETGVRGSSAKHAAADAVLAILADRDPDGTISNRRLVRHKVRAAATGGETPFAIRQVRLDEKGNTSCVIDWQDSGSSEERQSAKANPWRGKAAHLKRALDLALAEGGEDRRPYGLEGPIVRAVDRELVRSEFYAAYPSDEPDTKRKAFNRLVDDMVGKGRVGFREIAGKGWLWLVSH